MGLAGVIMMTLLKGVLFQLILDHKRLFLLEKDCGVVMIGRNDPEIGLTTVSAL